MGCQNNRGRVEAPRAATIYSEDKTLAEKQRVENLKLEKEKAEQLIQTIHQHDSMAIGQVGETKQLIIDLDFVNTGFIVDLPSLLKTLPLTDSKRPHNINHNRVEKLKQMVEVLNKFNIKKLKVIIGINDDDFYQMKLAAFVHGLNFQRWNMISNTFDEQGETVAKAKITRGSSYGRRLRGVYKAEFEAQ
ncbi:hypothetical protein BOTNAR_0738g00030 [Botryotinia narcissicola]|uniref:Uncharacterized protein n=1 Tax=Botryotinia narcissicola TaxID=278944 RepID=A0A4Z1H7L7_9HELO|nr:hypothetical protein BOTNAR_0738g00030 [Botryotinia narcissicola]